MIDIVDKETRSKWMQGIKGRNTKPEMLVRSYMHSCGHRFRLHRKDIRGRPDLWFSKHNAAIFVHGCFWHRHRGCKKATNPDENKAKWGEKFRANVVRDERNMAALQKDGIRVLVIWECALTPADRRLKTLSAAEKWLRSRKGFLELP